MKKLFIALVMIAGCAGSSEKHIQLVEQWIQQNANDPKSYEPIQFSKLDTVYKDFERSKVGQEISLDLLDVKTELGILDSEIKTEQTLREFGHGTDGVDLEVLKNKLEALKVKQSELDKKKAQAEAVYDKTKNYTLVLVHDFRAKNAMGAIIKQSYYFEFNDSLTKIIEAKPM